MVGALYALRIRITTEVNNAATIKLSALEIVDNIGQFYEDGYLSPSLEFQ